MEESQQKAIGQRLYLLRRNQDLTQQQAAARTHTTAKHISEIENGKALPSLGLLLNFSALYQRSTDYILTGMEFNERRPALSDPEMLRLYHKSQDLLQEWLTYNEKGKD